MENKDDLRQRAFQIAADRARQENSDGVVAHAIVMDLAAAGLLATPPEPDEPCEVCGRLFTSVVHECCEEVVALRDAAAEATEHAVLPRVWFIDEAPPDGTFVMRSSGEIERWNWDNVRNRPEEDVPVHHGNTDPLVEVFVQIPDYDEVVARARAVPPGFLVSSPELSATEVTGIREQFLRAMRGQS
jgi:hypothetical protein